MSKVIWQQASLLLDGQLVEKSRRQRPACREQGSKSDIYDCLVFQCMQHVAVQARNDVAAMTRRRCCDVVAITITARC